MLYLKRLILILIVFSLIVPINLSANISVDTNEKVVVDKEEYRDQVKTYYVMDTIIEEDKKKKKKLTATIFFVIICNIIKDSIIIHNNRK